MVLTNTNVINWLEAYILKKTLTASFTPVYEWDAEITSKLQERTDYYNLVHPDRTEYVAWMNKLDADLKGLYASRDVARETNRKKRESIDYQMSLKTATLEAAMTVLETKLKLITISPTV